MKVANAKILANTKILDNVYRMTINFDEHSCSRPRPGQFFMLKTLDNAFYLPRPISVNTAGAGTVTFLYRIEGSGTRALSKIPENFEIQAFGALGNGFDLTIEGNCAIIGGGIGTAPLLFLAQELSKADKPANVFLGFTGEPYLVDEFECCANKTVVETKDFITDRVDFENYDVIFTCGPEIMMKKNFASRKAKAKIYASLERRMACGLGACLGCSVETTSGIKRACKDGPVFDCEELKW